MDITATDDKGTRNTTTQAASNPYQTSGFAKRPYNPLSKYASYTYQLALYTMTPEYYNDVYIPNKPALLTNDPRIKLIAQSGGIQDTAQRAAGFNFDYYLDDLKITAIVAPDGRQTSTVSYDIEFKIYEQLGFKFISNLFQALQAFKSESPSLEKLTNSSRQFFALTVKFLGYDINGKLLQDDVVNGLNKVYDIICTGIKFKLDGGITVYNFKGVITRMDIMGTKKGLIDKGAFNLAGSNVKDVLTGLMTKLTENRKQSVKGGPSDTFRVEFVGESAQKIANARFATPSDTDKAKDAASAAIKNTEDVNPSVEIKSVPNTNSKELKFNVGTPILKAIENIIKLSDLNRNAIATVQNNTTQPNPTGTTQDSKTPYLHYSVTPEIVKTTRNNDINDYVYDIVYKIQSYEVPDMIAPSVNQTTKYYGAVKEYNFYYTGQNSEVIRFEQEFDNTFFTVALDTNGITSRAGGGGANIPTSTNHPPGGNTQGVSNPQNLTSINTPFTYLIDPAKMAQAKIEILGDPDWLGQDILSTDTYVNPDNLTINFSAKQVFIEIRVKEPVDYDHNTGVVQLNENILFWNYPKSVRDQLKGKISYRVIKVISTFKSGKFTQQLELVITTFPDDPKEQTVSNATSENRTSAPVTGLTPDKPNSTAGNTNTSGTLAQPTNGTPLSASRNDDAYVNGTPGQEVGGGTIFSLGAGA